MAELNIKITTDYKQTQEAFQSVTENVKSYEKELLKQKSIADADQAAMDNYIKSMTKKLGAIEATKDGMAKLNAQSKLLRDAIYELNGAWGEGNAVSQHFQKQLDLIKGKMSEVATSSGGVTTKLLSVAKNILRFQLLMAPITAAIRGFKNTLSDSVKVAAEAEQVYNKLATVFDTVADSAKRASQEMATTLGVATSTAASALSTVGDLLQAQGMGTAQSLSTSVEWVKQFQDIIAFKDINMSLEEFAQNFMSGAAGNLRNFRTFGSIVKESAVNARLAAQGLDKLTGSELELAKMTTRAEMALEQQANAMGATEREWESMLSINRRLAEQEKIFKENLGDTMNAVLKPLKSMWTDILTEINKATQAQKEFNAGAKEINVYDIKNNASDAANFRNAVLRAQNEYRVNEWNAGMGATGYGDGVEYDRSGIEKALFDTLTKLMIQYTASSSDIIKLLSGDMPMGLEASLIKWEEDNAEQVRILKEIQARNTETENVATGYDNFLEALMGIKGVGTNLTIPTEMNANSHMSFAQQLAIEGRQAAIEAFNNINSSDLSEFVDAVSLALGEVDETDMIKGKAESLKSLYSVLYNQFTKDKTLEENADLLKRIADEYKSITGEVVEINNGLTEFQKALAQMQGFTTDYDVKLAQVGMSDKQKATDNLRRQYEEAYALATTAEEQGQINDAYEQAEQTLLAFYNAQEKYNDGLKAEADEKERLAKYEDAIKSIQESTADYAKQMKQIGMTDEEKALDDLRIAYEKQKASLDLTQTEAEALDAEYEIQRQALIDLQARQKEYNDALAAQAAILAAAEAAVTAARNGDTAKAKMLSFQNSISPLKATGKYAEADTWRANQKASLRNTEEELLKLGLSASEVNAWIAEMIPLINEEYEAKKREIDAAEEAAEALKKVQTWTDIGERALGATGTLGSVVGQFTDDEGDIWSDIVNALLTIMENTEGWADIAATLDQIFEMFEPVVDGFINLILSLPWEDIIYMLKVVATVLVTIMGIIRGIQEVFKWLWDNIKVALNNVKEAILHPITGGDQRSFRSFDNLKQTIIDVAEDVKEEYERIWAVNEKIERNTRKDDVLKTLKKLYAAGVINEDQFYAGARVIQKNKVFDPVPAGSPKYLSSPSQTSTTISYGGVTLQFNGGDTEEIKRWLLNLFNGNGIPYNTAIGG